MRLLPSPHQRAVRAPLKANGIIVAVGLVAVSCLPLLSWLDPMLRSFVTSPDTKPCGEFDHRHAE